MRRMMRAGAPYYAAVAALHALALTLLFLAARQAPILPGLGLLAYTLGLRHAFDADHIAAVDNTVRKLLQLKRDPNGVGFFFSLGHSTIVFLMALLLGLTGAWARDRMPGFQAVGGVIGATISGLFLLLTAAFNAAALAGMARAFRRLRERHRGAAGAPGAGAAGVSGADIDALLDRRGLLPRLCGRLFAVVTRSWQVYPIGLLFGLGFDTATEVALLAMSAGATTSSVPLAGTLALPLLFASGMCLMDTTDSVVMTGAYRWAFDTPVRKLYYNLTITLASVTAAVVIGGVELLQVVGSALGLDGGFWAWVQGLDFNGLGYAMAAVFVGFWIASGVVWKVGHVARRWS
ncbi:HoxN/HupN/NixA family nickel/cobalt transporter [Bifidobacterium pullorum subsp. saeculare]|uniref:Nickel/cobalt efflux system n=1 Tax=Bifidobacterium pullorum subsp. saeculare TaxID=78257 RepID=A0A939BAI8_9BIFI|nr:HoxN/HupN/NixA family nickel/cobalt transporter [Bifidobacterium pullorum]MBM6700400.1 HoxN/HupN/NixA family nickel/cobalt transporter [Bifidobacterium pullorum subsp. saeculare]